MFEQATKRGVFLGWLLATSFLILAGCSGGGSGSSGSSTPADTTPPVTALTTPDGGEDWGGTQNITWTTTDANPGTVEIRLSNDSGGSYPTVIAAAAPDTGTFSWDTTAAADDTTCQIQVTPTDTEGNVGTPADSAADFTIDNIAPTIALTAPAGGEAWSATQNITWTTTDANPGTVEIRLSNDSGGSYPTVIAAAAPDTGTFSWDTTTVADAATYRIQVTPTDTLANVGTPAESGTDYTVDNTPPTVLGFASYTDENTNSTADAGDKLVIPFDRSVTVNGSTDADFTLPVVGDVFGTGATVAAGPGTSEVTITVGASPSLKSRQIFNPANTLANDPSGIDISATMAADAIENTAGVDAVPSTPLDIIPAFVDSGQALGNNNTYSVALGDVDSDGDGDIVVGNNGANLVWLNDGTGTFSDSGQTLGTTSTRSVALGDVDSDGDLDMVEGNEGGQPNRVWLNDGTGTFTDSGQTLGSSSTISVALGDVDSDGDLDMVAGNNGPGNRVWLNNGSGTFTDSGQALGSSLTHFIALGDVDGDGDLDIVAGNNGAVPNLVWLNDDTGTFTDSGQTLGSSSTISVALGDVDSDGDLDMVEGNFMQPNRVWLN